MKDEKGNENEKELTTPVPAQVTYSVTALLSGRGECHCPLGQEG